MVLFIVVVLVWLVFVVFYDVCLLVWFVCCVVCGWFVCCVVVLCCVCVLNHSVSSQCFPRKESLLQG